MENQSGSASLSVKEWVITLLVASIPMVGFIMLFVWAFGSDTNPNKANWAKALLIWTAIGIVIGVLFFAVFGAAFLATLSQGGGY